MEQACYVKRLYKLAADVLGSDENGREWLTTASKDFGGKSPIDYANEILKDKGKSKRKGGR